jgi:hypothetical protein
MIIITDYNGLDGIEALENCALHLVLNAIAQ